MFKNYTTLIEAYYTILSTSYTYFIQLSLSVDYQADNTATSVTVNISVVSELQLSRVRHFHINCII